MVYLQPHKRIYTIKKTFDTQLVYLHSCHQIQPSFSTALVQQSRPSKFLADYLGEDYEKRRKVSPPPPSTF